MTAPTIRFEEITKRFPGVVALDRVSLEIAPGSCHALCGQNGAGKSTLGKILAGIYRPDGGRLLIAGTPVHFTTPRDALAAGVGMVHQELAFCENLTVADNLCLGDLPTRRGLIAADQMAARAERMLAEIGASLDVHKPVGQLTIAQRQVVQIAGAVGRGARIIVFDEPTSSLSQVEAERLYQLIRRLKASGTTCIYVSHRMTEIFQLTDTISVLRDGQHVGTRPTAGLSEFELVAMMIGRVLATAPRTINRSGAGAELLSVDALASPGKFGPISFGLRAGEVVGLAGLVGAGRSELALALFGLDPDATGEIRIGGRPTDIPSPRAAIAAGLGLVPEDRKRQGLIPGGSTLENVSLPILDRISRLRWVNRILERSTVQRVFGQLNVRAPRLDAAVSGLSGGNQQKVLLARWLAADAKVLILDEPTRGVDVGAKSEIHAEIARLAENGHAVLMISSELPEILALSHRILVVRQGVLVGEVAGSAATEDGLLRMMTGIDRPTAA